MKSLFYISNYQTPHLETDLELIRNSYLKGKETHVLVCKGLIKTCFQNPKHSTILCKLCQSKIEYGLKLIDGIKIHHQKEYQFALPKKDEISTLEKIKNFKFDGISIGRGIVSSLISTIRDHRFDVDENEEIIYDSIYSAILNYLNFQKLVEELRPSEVYFFNGRFSEVFPLMELCKVKEITYYTHERGADNYKYMLRKNDIPHSIDYTSHEIKKFWKNNDPKKEVLAEKFFSERIDGIEQNWFSFSKEQKSNYLPHNFDCSKINISIFNSSMDEYETIPDFKNLIYDNDNEGIESICKSFEGYDNIHFYLRVHPNLKNMNNTQMREIRRIDNNFRNITVIYPEEKIDSYELVRQSDAVLTFNSTIGIESLYLGTKSILLGRAFYESIDEIIKCYDHEEVISEIFNVQKGKRFKFTQHLKYGYWAKSFGNKYKYYKPYTLFSGEFDGKNLNSANLKILLWRLANKIFCS